MGQRNGVAAKLKSTVNHVIAVHCIAHRLELGVSKAIKDHTRLKRLNDVLIFLYEQYHYSPKALRELRMLGEALEEKVLKPTNLKGSRWVPYIFKATKVWIVFNYSTLSVSGPVYDHPVQACIVPANSHCLFQVLCTIILSRHVLFQLTSIVCFRSYARSSCPGMYCSS